MPGSDRVYPDLEERDWELTPDHLRSGISLYISEGIIPGSFLQAVICNDLKEAAFTADNTNYHRLGDIARFMYWHTPTACQGSREKMIAWHDHQGLKGLMDDHRSQEGA